MTTGHPVYDSGYTFDSGANCSKTGYTIQKWSCTGSNGTADRALSENVQAWNLDTDLNCVAQWQPNTINIDWDPNNGDSPFRTTCEYDGDIELPTAPDLKGYRFTGWKLQNKAGLCIDITDRDTCNASFENGKSCYWAMNVYTSEYECKVHK